MMVERAPDGRIILRFPPLPEPDPDPVFECMMCNATVQEWKMPHEMDICRSCLHTLRLARGRFKFHEETFRADAALDFARDIISTIEHEIKRHGK